MQNEVKENSANLFSIRISHNVLKKRSKIQTNVNNESDYHWTYG